MLDTTMMLTVVIAVMIAALLGWLIYLQRKGRREEQQQQKSPSPLILQAYERIALMTDRIALPNLAARISPAGLSAREMQYVLTKTIRDEFDYNVTQQVYLAPEIWNAVKGLKEKNLLIINQIGSIVPETASGADLLKAILEFLMNDEKANLHELVSEALSFEAKKHL
ncbi:DUF7935 family protein [Sediminibacterium ginsengisoli]|uniref:Uncharacterized protein n=1 Tax=Sediminibacterium ginsengisoli TaxID=413434 RepID=A0A1T4PGK5_9BACT|nr:hypothetical protein [Sediminibacterium ginsengisoli]SJZ90713.1 hypothetical protein SAMN04488132_1066 [Sediminibacterium ginsengisoli]